MALATSSFAVQPGNERYYADHGWLKTFHSLSFADYWDPANTHWGALRVFNDDRIAARRGFPTHPHANMEILTYVLAGRLEHRDTLGSHGIVEAGGVQFLSAGTGLQHSEFNAGDAELHLVQMWVLPGTVDAVPTYGQIDFDAAARRNRWLAVASGETADAPIRLTQSATLRVAGLADARIDYVFAPGRLGFLFAGSGNAEVTARNAEGQTYRAKLGPGDAIRMRDLAAFDVGGTAELVFWDVPPLEG